MRLIIYSMLGLLIVIQYPLWFGQGGLLKAYELERQLDAQIQKNKALEIRNNKLAGDVKDLKEGTRAIEERARSEHGMLKEGEYFVQIVPKEGAPSSPNAAPVPATPKQ